MVGRKLVVHSGRGGRENLIRKAVVQIGPDTGFFVFSRKGGQRGSGGARGCKVE